MRNCFSRVIVAACVVTAAASLRAEVTTSPAPLTGEGKYYVLPVTGALEDGSAKVFGEAVENARKAKASHLLLLMDTTGGNLPEVQTMLELLVGAKDLKLVAVVRRAGAMTALLPLACETVLTMPDATFGGTRNPLAGKRKTDGPSPGGPAAKLAVQKTHRDELLARGFMELDIVLGITSETAPGKARLVLVDDPPGRRKPKFDGAIVKPQGEIMQLTAEQAIRLGISSGTVATFPSEDPGTDAVARDDPVAAALRLGVWKCVGSSAKAMEKVTQSSARREYLRNHADELKKLDKKIAELELQEKEVVAEMQARNYAMKDYGPRARQTAQNRNARSQVHLAKVREDLKDARSKRDVIMKAAPRE